MTAVRGVLLDVDGTLLDSNDAHARAWVAALAQHGRTVAFDQVRTLIGKGGDKLLAECVGIDDDSAEGQAIGASRRAWFADRELPALQPTRGARDLLLALRERGLKRVVATSAGGDELQALLSRAGIGDLVEAAATSSDAPESKPDPDIVHAALRKIGLPADAVLMLGDTPYDIEAAQRAGVATVALRCGGCWDDLALAGAIAIHDDPAALLADLDATLAR